ncbi:response regulator transcription factor [Streptomyces sp. ISL-94]|uniref:response regulator transcription factor n=1 Tax=Streptomyces sp. ISL-94 TaxID=2819190 RepID=UPI001BEBF528|nr:response regulator transcription factor [Streptomyces sp. ISL-94]MBT2482196.1 response regulator transcription factor [Streptomyces sp. ISL-94]
MAIRVVIADDQEMVRTGFRMTLESRPDIEVAADVVNGEAALAAVAEHRPDVLLPDIRMPALDGLEVTRRLSGNDTPRIVIVTPFDLDEYAHAAIHGGASGFLLKDASPAVLVEAVRSAAVGDSRASAAITARLLREMAPRTPARRPAEPLTDRERDVVRCAARGQTHAEIAGEQPTRPCLGAPPGHVQPRRRLRRGDAGSGV